MIEYKEIQKQKHMTKKQEQKGKNSNNLSLENIYDMIMYEVEPELITCNIAELDLIYQNETEEEKLERGKRYEEAFEQLFIRLENLMGVWKLELDEYKDKVMQKFTEKSKKEDAEALSDIETSIDKQ